jgi:hypothetical protein
VPVEVRIDVERGVVIRRAWGEVTVNELTESFSKVLQDPDYRSGMPSLSDLRDLKVTGFTPTIRGIAEFIERRREQTGAARAAVVVSSEAAYGLLRMLQALTHKSPMEIRPFRKMEEALEWLGLDADILEQP